MRHVSSDGRHIRTRADFAANYCETSLTHVLCCAEITMWRALSWSPRQHKHMPQSGSAGVCSTSLNAVVVYCIFILADASFCAIRAGATAFLRHRQSTSRCAPCKSSPVVASEQPRRMQSWLCCLKHRVPVPGMLDIVSDRPWTRPATLRSCTCRAISIGFSATRFYFETPCTTTCSAPLPHGGIWTRC